MQTPSINNENTEKIETSRRSQSLGGSKYVLPLNRTLGSRVQILLGYVCRWMSAFICVVLCRQMSSDETISNPSGSTKRLKDRVSELIPNCNEARSLTPGNWRIKHKSVHNKQPEDGNGDISRNVGYNKYTSEGGQYTRQLRCQLLYNAIKV
jgi:hypothetical protein